MKFILISVYEREITTRNFDTFEEAHDQMICELKEQFFGTDCDDVPWYAEEYMCEDFGFSARDAWSNIDDDCNCDWKIVII